MNVVYLPQLTDESTEEYNTDEYMALYSLVPRNIVGTPLPRPSHVSIYSLVSRGTYSHMFLG
jgi:hypothetical protein